MLDLSRVLLSNFSGRFAIRTPPNTRYKISALKRIIAIPVNGPTKAFGISIIHGIANGRSNMPDSPESAGFFEATKKIHTNVATARNRNIPAAMIPPIENLMLSFNIVCT
jgi:hypothetical protein